ncbi:MAG TPA: hypothetical protein VLM42_08260 [Bryobacteraceae bacterium]|nr:hypothetical protein [Bryobacteraceae bacterium]
MRRWIGLGLLAATLMISGCAAYGGYGYGRDYRYGRGYRYDRDYRHGWHGDHHDRDDWRYDYYRR